VILVSQKRFSVSAYHTEANPDHAARDQAKGPLIRVRVRFQQWLDGKEAEADAFLDPGADMTVVSARWIALLSERLDPATDLLLDGNHIDEPFSIGMGACDLPVPRTEVGPLLWSQPGDMAGYEDILLGRDFFEAHRLLIVFDGESRDFSVLLPDDHENQRRRDQVRLAISGSIEK
jgi:hypothetical protein